MSTTCEDLRKIIPKNDLLPVKTLKFKNEACLQNTLGVTWSSQNDCLKFDCSFSNEIPEKLTRRIILSIYSRIFDPLDFKAICIASEVNYPRIESFEAFMG